MHLERAQVLIETDVTKPIPEAIMVEFKGQKLKIKVTHENHPDFCSKIWHMEGSCYLKNPLSRNIEFKKVAPTRFNHEGQSKTSKSYDIVEQYVYQDWPKWITPEKISLVKDIVNHVKERLITKNNFSTLVELEGFEAYGDTRNSI